MRVVSRTRHAYWFSSSSLPNIIKNTSKNIKVMKHRRMHLNTYHNKTKSKKDYQAQIIILNRAYAHSKLLSMHILMKSDEKPPEIINERIYIRKLCGIYHKEDILPLHEPHTRENYLTFFHSSLSQGTY